MLYRQLFLVGVGVGVEPTVLILRSSHPNRRSIAVFFDKTRKEVDKGDRP